MRHILPLVIAFAAASAAPAVALADIAPSDSCTTAGSSCDNAGPASDEPGTCQASTCQRATPTGPMSYDCTKCVAGTGSGGSGTGAAGAPGSGGAPSSEADAASEDEDSGDGKSKDDGGCSVGARGGSSGLASVLLGLGLGALFFRRR